MKRTDVEIKAELKTAEEMLITFIDAEKRVVIGGQSMIIDDGDMKRAVTRADAKWISTRISYWRTEVKRLELELATGGTGRKGIYVRPL